MRGSEGGGGEGEGGGGTVILCRASHRCKLDQDYQGRPDGAAISRSPSSSLILQEISWSAGGVGGAWGGGHVETGESRLLSESDSSYNIATCLFPPTRQDK